VARDVVFLETVGINPVVVHGGGKAITRALKESGEKTEFIQGQRRTSEETVQVVERVLSREVNPDIVDRINKLGGKARGFSGADIFTCRKKLLKTPEGEELDVGFVGEVTGANLDPIRQCIWRSVTPVISPTAKGEDGQIYNCNADVAAAQMAIALKARRLFFMSDVPGLLQDPKDPGSLISPLSVDEVDALQQSGVIDVGMIPKVDRATEAVRAGVNKVAFIHGRLQHAVLLEIFTDKGVGTEVVLE